jgi:hypothetical protein
MVVVVVAVAEAYHTAVRTGVGRVSTIKAPEASTEK